MSEKEGDWWEQPTFLCVAFTACEKGFQQARESSCCHDSSGKPRDWKDLHQLTTAILCQRNHIACLQCWQQSQGSACLSNTPHLTLQTFPLLPFEAGKYLQSIKNRNSPAHLFPLQYSCPFPRINLSRITGQHLAFPYSLLPLSGNKNVLETAAATCRKPIQGPAHSVIQGCQCNKCHYCYLRC